MATMADRRDAVAAEILKHVRAGKGEAPAYVRMTCGTLGGILKALDAGFPYDALVARITEHLMREESNARERKAAAPAPAPESSPESAPAPESK